MDGDLFADMGIPITLIAEAVYSRCVSAMKDERVKTSKVFKQGKPKFAGDRTQWIADIRRALYASKIISYAQGYMLMRAAAKQYNWNLNYGGIALMWRGGCIIRSAFLGDITKAFAKNRTSKICCSMRFSEGDQGSTRSWRKVVSMAVQKGIPVPAFSTALAFFDGIRSERLPANLLQAAARLLRRAYLRARRQAARRVLSTPTGPARAGACRARPTGSD
jgi:6-phosphogluconate dehydrogenase